MAELIQINNSTDVIDDTQTITTGYFTGNLGSLAAGNLVTASLSSTQKNYYYNLQYSSEDQFSVAFGHINGSGSGAAEETKAVYMQFKTLLLDGSDIASTASNGFQFSVSSSTAVNDHEDCEDYMYFVVADRARMKDKLNKKNWTLRLSGSKGISDAVGTGSLLELTDDSSTTTGVSTQAGMRYNVVSGSDGSVYSASTWKTFGHFYPQMGIIALRGRELSGSLPGTAGSVDTASFHVANINTGFAPEITTDGTADNACKLALAMNKGAQAFRSEEEQNSKSYFIRAFANDMNYTNNPTFTSGSLNQLRHTEMLGYPITFITTVGLYQNSSITGEQELVAIGRLSGPVEKNYGTEATIKVKLTY